MRTIAGLMALGGALVASQMALAPAASASDRFNVAVYGDSPYGTTPTDTAQQLATPAFIAGINADTSVSLVLHVGDIHSGKQFCTEAYDRTVRGLWSQFQKPLIYTPGDNEWTDCHKAAEGGGAYNPLTQTIDFKKDANGNLIDYAAGNPVENLKLVRSIFFPFPGSATVGRKNVISQARAFDRAHRSDSQFVENAMWMQGDVLFFTVNIPGGSNNDSDIWYGAPTMSATQTQEIANRTGAALRWIDAAFNMAREEGAKAVVIQSQADMWDLDGKPATHIANYKVFVDKIAARTKAFVKPVLMLNGDSHVYRSDNPMFLAATCRTESGVPGGDTACAEDAYANQPLGYNVPNFHRIVVHGSTSPLEWLKLTVNTKVKAPAGPNAFGPFAWTRQVQQ